jgi:DNA polymerase III subunit delta'
MAFLPADILERLRRAREHGRLPHAMLITGTPGSGRSRLALEIAALVNDTTAEKAATHPDVHKLEPGSKSRRILVEPFRDFCQPFFSTSFRAGATKTGIILDADRLHLNAANAFLKTLEEPPDNTLFILVTSNPGLLPVTIVSRCAHFPLRTAKLPDLDGPAAEVAAATGDVLSAPARTRLGAGLRLARRLQSLLRDAREAVEDEVSAAFKAEKKRLGDTAEEDWLKDEEVRLKALVEARVLATRQHLVGVVAERTADVLRARHGVDALQFPALAAESRRLAALFDDAALLRVLDGAARLRLFLDRNVKEDIALEAGCLALARS